MSTQQFSGEDLTSRKAVFCEAVLSLPFVGVVLECSWGAFSPSVSVSTPWRIVLALSGTAAAAVGARLISSFRRVSAGSDSVGIRKLGHWQCVPYSMITRVRESIVPPQRLLGCSDPWVIVDLDIGSQRRKRIRFWPRARRDDRLDGLRPFDYLRKRMR